MGWWGKQHCWLVLMDPGRHHQLATVESNLLLSESSQGLLGLHVCIGNNLSYTHRAEMFLCLGCLHGAGMGQEHHVCKTRPSPVKDGSL